MTSGYILFGIYIVTLVYITIFCLLQLHLLYKYLQGNRNPNIPHHKEEDVYPMVTIQLPVYNEKYVIERLIDNIVRLDYPKTKMEIQILDDSTDDTAVKLLDVALEKGTLNKKVIDREKKVRFFRENFPAD